MSTTTRTHQLLRLAAGSVAATMVLGACSGPDTVNVTLDEAALQAALDEWREDQDVYGVTMAIRVPGHDDVHLASGVDGRGPETPMPTDGTYDIFSITKSFTAAAALQLVDEGLLSLDEPVDPWLPELPNAEQITLAMLLGHTAGIGNWTGMPPEAADDYVPTMVADLGRSFSPDEVLAKHLEQPLIGEPGEQHAYRNANYDAVGMIIQREVGQDLAEVFAERLIDPLGLEDTALTDGSISPMLHGWFSLDDDPDRMDSWLDTPQQAVMTSLWAAGGMISSSADLLDWGEALYSGDLLGDDLTVTMINLDLGVEGWCFDAGGCEPGGFGLIGKGGGAPWRETLVTHHRESGITIVIHANTDPGTWLMPLAADVTYELGLEEKLEAGTHSSQEFEPALTYDLPDGWENWLDRAYEFGLGTEDPVSGDIVVIRDPVPLIPDTAEESAGAVADDSVGGSAGDLVAWLTGHPELSATGPVDVTVGGLDGVRMDLTVASGSTSSTWWCEPDDTCVDVVGTGPLEDWVAIVDSADGSGPVRVYVLTLPGGDGSVLIWVNEFENTDTSADVFFEEAESVIDTFSFAD